MLPKFLTGGALAALAAALAFTAAPAAAQTALPGWGDGPRASRGHSERAAPAPRAQAPRAREQRSQSPSPRAERNRGAGERSRGAWNAGDGQRQVPRNWNRGDGVAQAQPQRNRTYVDPNRNTTYRDRSRDNDHTWRSGGDRDRRRDGDRNWRGNGGDNDRNWRDRRGDNDRNWRGNDRNWRNGQLDNRRWNRSWRNDRRYDWQRYRALNRHVYHIGRYYAPYRNYSYRRLSIGFSLDPLFFGSRYWISDPWQYRLPEVYGPYRWVRYYDDALLVDIYSGQVVDVIYDFFW